VRRSFYLFGIFKQHEFKVPIISVGNLTFGGTGKTPFTMYLSKYFIEKKKRVLILMRGYKGRLEKGSGLLTAGKKLGFNPFDFGDEALLLAKNLENTSVAVGKNRVLNLRKYFDEVSPDIVILDDGHQHLKLKRNINVVLFDAMLPLSSYKVAPSGYLREGLGALNAADIVIVNRVDQVRLDKVEALKNKIKKYLNPGVPVLDASYVASGIYDKENRFIAPCTFLKGKNIICFAGIAGPESFFKLVETIGGNILDKIVYPDHHSYDQEDIKILHEMAKDKSAICLTTEKDIVKVRSLPQSENIKYLEIKLSFADGAESLYKMLDELMC